MHQINNYPMVGPGEYTYSALYREPNLIVGIGMNYLKKAEDLNAFPPDQEPVSFLKPNSILIGPGEKIKLPAGSTNVTAEAELGIIIGKTCRNIEAEKIPQYLVKHQNRPPRFHNLNKIDRMQLLSLLHENIDKLLRSENGQKRRINTNRQRKYSLSALCKQGLHWIS